MFLLFQSLSRVQLFYDPMDCSPPGSSVHEISQARILEWVAMSFFRESSRPRDWTCISHVSCIIGGFFSHWAIGTLVLSNYTTGQTHHIWSLPLKKTQLVVKLKMQKRYIPSSSYVCVKSLSRVWLFETPWTVVCQAPLSMGFSRQEYWTGLPFPSPYQVIVVTYFIDVQQLLK